MNRYFLLHIASAAASVTLEVEFALCEPHVGLNFEISADLSGDTAQALAQAILAVEVVCDSTALIARFAVVVDDHQPLIVCSLGDEIVRHEWNGRAQICHCNGGLSIRKGDTLGKVRYGAEDGSDSNGELRKLY